MSGIAKNYVSSSKCPNQLSYIVFGEGYGLLIIMLNPAHGCQKKVGRESVEVSRSQEKVSRESVKVSRSQ